jgi:hypothetical protein
LHATFLVIAAEQIRLVDVVGCVVALVAGPSGLAAGLDLNHLVERAAAQPH